MTPSNPSIKEDDCIQLNTSAIKQEIEEFELKAFKQGQLSKMEDEIKFRLDEENCSCYKWGSTEITCKRCKRIKQLNQEIETIMESLK